ncbi:linear amide C-N hydrolase [Floridanema aerugineum]|uniref:Linear amide C-N hydrolase n=1 Tax=Floridaenema aerugineum BLCC-F46 TaxID=3153654 RepID=A0ABV4XEC0_9CYAN
MCTRVVYLGPEDTIVTARSMDWRNRDMESNLWALPKEMERKGAAGDNSIKWTSKYGSVVTTFMDSGSADGMNEAGLVANMLYLTETKYPTPIENDPRNPLALSAWVQYVLDNYATVKEAVEALRKEPFYIVPIKSPDYEVTKAEGTTHLAISDPTGDSAIFQYIDGKLNIYHDRKYQVMTNSPPYDQQLALNQYWEQIGGTTMLPGTNRAADRFVRASFYIKAIPQTSDINEAIAGVFSVIRNVSVPLGISTPNQPNISSTLWRVVADHKNKRYFFESTRSPNVFWVNLSDLNFAKGESTKKLTLKDNQFLVGNVAKKFESCTPFQFLPAKH